MTVRAPLLAATLLLLPVTSALAAPPGPRPIGEVKCDVDGDGTDDTVRVTVDDKDRSAVVLMRGTKAIGEVAGPSAPSKVEARQVVRDKACEIAVITDGSVKLALFKWKKKAFAELVRFEKTPPTYDAGGDEDVLANAGKTAAGRTVWVWNADKFIYDGPVVEARCDVDGDGADDAVRLGAESLTVLGKGKLLATLPLPAGTLQDRPFAVQTVGDKACEIAVTGKSTKAQQVRVWKWRADKLAVIADVTAPIAASVMWKAGAESAVEVRDGKKVVETWRWNEPRFAFRLQQGTPVGLCTTDNDCAAAAEDKRYCDLTLVEEKPAPPAAKKKKGKAAVVAKKPIPQGICSAKPAEAKKPTEAKK